MKTLLYSFMLMLSLSAFAQTTEQIVNGLMSKKTAVEAIVDQLPYKEEQHQAIEGYFVGLNRFTLDVKNSTNTARRFNSSVSRVGVANFCSRFFLDANRQADLVRNCTRNSFFLCAEEVRAYSEMKSTLRNALSDSLKRSFDASPPCSIN